MPNICDVYRQLQRSSVSLMSIQWHNDKYIHAREVSQLWKNQSLEGIVQMLTTGLGIDLQTRLDFIIHRDKVDRVPRMGSGQNGQSTQNSLDSVEGTNFKQNMTLALPYKSQKSKTCKNQTVAQQLNCIHPPKKTQEYLYEYKNILHPTR